MVRDVLCKVPHLGVVYLKSRFFSQIHSRQESTQNRGVPPVPTSQCEVALCCAAAVVAAAAAAAAVRPPPLYCALRGLLRLSKGKPVERLLLLWG